MAGHHQHAAEFVKQHQQLGAPHVLVVHDLLQMVSASEIVQQPAGKEQGRRVGQEQANTARTDIATLEVSSPMAPNQEAFGLHPSFT